MKFVFLLFIILIQFEITATAQLITYKAPVKSILNNDFTVRVRQKGQVWQTISVYLAKVANGVEATGKISAESTSFCYFDFLGEVEVAVTYNKGLIRSARVRPFAGVTSVKRKTISFVLTEPHNISVEVNGDIFHNLQLFANALETSHPAASDPGVIYFGPGYHRVDSVNLRSNTTVYISGGAVVEGNFNINHAANVRILGHGIIYHSKKSISISNSNNITVDGVIVVNPAHNTVGINMCDHVTIRNLRSFSDQSWGDGIDIYCSSNVLIDRVFMRNSDDNIAVYGHRGPWYGNVNNITVQNSALWADVAHPVLIGTHGDPPHPDTLQNIKFINIDILDHHENQIDYQGCLAINAGDGNLVRNIRFENIRIGDFRKGQIFNIRVMYNHKYNTGAGGGIENIYLKNVSYTGSHANMAVIAGYDDGHLVKDITFDGLMINGKMITDKMPGKPGFYKTGDMANIFIGEHVQNVRFINTSQ